MEDWESGNVTTSVGESGQCICHVYVPDTTFPADRVQHMQQVSKDLLLEVEIQMNKVHIVKLKSECCCNYCIKEQSSVRHCNNSCFLTLSDGDLQ